jgi:dihydroflavonol-4-reductase
VGENVTYKDLFTKFSHAFGNKAPTMPLTPAMLNFGWRVERMRTLLLGGSPLVTRSTAHSSIISRRFSNHKVRDLLGMEFRNADEAIVNVAGYLEGRRNTLAQYA